jgi:hypothetical protein
LLTKNQLMSIDTLERDHKLGFVVFIV